MISFQPSSGNSSAVEHDLAKVGVASSNLVSRSIIFFLFMISLLNASNNYTINKSYCVDNLTKVKSSLFTKNKKNDFKIIDLPKNRTTYKISSLKIISKFKAHNIRITDLSNGIVDFKICKKILDFTDAEKLLAKKYISKYPTIKIQKIYITSASPLSPSLSLFRLFKIDIKEYNYRNSKATFGAIYKRGEATKKIYLKYKIDANISVFKANYNLRNGKILNPDDYRKAEIKLDNLPLNIIIGNITNDYIVKGYVRKDSILSTNNLKIKKNLLKGAFIKARIKEENMILDIDAHLLSDANIGDKVKLQTTNGKILNAKIISLKIAKIIE